jgi:Asp-tRNA(Asn)/Glu-tRNA(Gln) amidotransferase A subunit family amidase
MIAEAGGSTAQHAARAAPPDSHHAVVESVVRPASDRGPLAGLTFVAKDCLELHGRAPGCGLAKRGAGPDPLADAPVIVALVAAGARLTGMAQMTPLAFEPSGDNPALGRPLNPRNPAFVCGGSSSGSAVAVAAGLADFAIGTDTAGSVRIPAHCCGVTGWKPTPGLVPTGGVMPLAESLDCVGFLVGDASRLGWIAKVMQAEPLGPFRGLVLAEDAVADSAPSIQEACDMAAMLASAATGLPLRKAAALPLIRACDEPVFTLLQGEAYRAHRGRIEAGSLDTGLARRLAKGAVLSAADLAMARTTLAGLAETALLALLGADEVLLVPGMPCETPRITLCDPQSPDFSPRALYALSAFTRFANGLGLPVVSLPVGLDGHGLPIGLQLVARPGRDADLIALATRLAAALAAQPFDPASVPRPMP